MKKMDDGRRINRVEKEIQVTIAQFLIQGFKLPLPGIVTVSAVKMPGDLRTAKVYVSVLGSSNEDQKQAVKTLQERAFEIQNYIGKELKMRYCPKLTFLEDHNTEQVLKIERIIKELNIPKLSEESEQDDE